MSLEILPKEIIFIILLELEIQDIFSFSLLNHFFHNLGKEFSIFNKSKYNSKKLKNLIYGKLYLKNTFLMN